MEQLARLDFVVDVRERDKLYKEGSDRVKAEREKRRMENLFQARLYIGSPISASSDGAVGVHVV